MLAAVLLVQQDFCRDFDYLLRTIWYLGGSVGDFDRAVRLR